MSSGEKLALLVADKVDNMAKKMEDQTSMLIKAIEKLTPFVNPPQQIAQQAITSQSTIKVDQEEPISQKYFTNCLKKKILEICEDFCDNPDKTWLSLVESHVDETFEIKSKQNCFFKLSFIFLKKFFIFRFYRADAIITTDFREDIRSIF